jgi:hypothetical protein
MVGFTHPTDEFGAASRSAIDRDSPGRAASRRFALVLLPARRPRGEAVADGLAPWSEAHQGGVERSALSLSDNAVVGHTRIDRVAVGCGSRFPLDSLQSGPAIRDSHTPA